MPYFPAARPRKLYNVCCFVEFDGDGERWVVRVPLEPCLAFGGASKLDSEVATMQYVCRARGPKTKMPREVVPRA